MYEIILESLALPQYTKIPCENKKCSNLVPRLFLRGRKDPGRSWSRATQILGGKLKQHLGRGGRVLRLENYNLCA